MNTPEMLRHYIYIDSDSPHEDIDASATLDRIKQIHRDNMLCGETVIYWSYDDISVLLKEYDEGLYQLFMSINTELPALLADIGRCIILYTHGGVYNDLKFMTTKKMTIYLNDCISNNIELVADIPPYKRNQRTVRNSNMVALSKEHLVFDCALQEYKRLLSIAGEKKWFSRKHLWAIGTKSYVNCFFKHAKSHGVTKVNMQWGRLVLRSGEIYRMRSRAWLKTNVQILNYEQT